MDRAAISWLDSPIKMAKGCLFTTCNSFGFLFNIWVTYEKVVWKSSFLSKGQLPTVQLGSINCISTAIEEMYLLGILEFVLQGLDGVLDLVNLSDQTVLCVISAQLHVGPIGTVLQTGHGQL